MATERQISGWTCGYCGKQFEGSDSKAQEASHPAICPLRPVGCEVCFQRLFSPESAEERESWLEMHKKTCPMREVSCAKCGLSFSPKFPGSAHAADRWLKRHICVLGGSPRVCNCSRCATARSSSKPQSPRSSEWSSPHAILCTCTRCTKTRSNKSEKFLSEADAWVAKWKSTPMWKSEWLVTPDSPRFAGKVNFDPSRSRRGFINGGRGSLVGSHSEKRARLRDELLRSKQQMERSIRAEKAMDQQERLSRMQSRFQRVSSSRGSSPRRVDTSPGPSSPSSAYLRSPSFGSPYPTQCPRPQSAPAQRSLSPRSQNLEHSNGSNESIRASLYGYVFGESRTRSQAASSECSAVRGSATVYETILMMPGGKELYVKRENWSVDDKPLIRPRTSASQGVSSLQPSPRQRTRQ